MVRRTIKEAAMEFIRGKFHRIKECDEFIAALGKYPQLQDKIRKLRDSGASLSAHDVECLSSRS
jgi:hypothetical protein